MLPCRYDSTFARHRSGPGAPGRSRCAAHAAGRSPEIGVLLTASRSLKRNTVSCPAINSAFDFEADGSIVNSISTPSLTIFCGPRSCALTVVKAKAQESKVAKVSNRIIGLQVTDTDIPVLSDMVDMLWPVSVAREAVPRRRRQSGTTGRCDTGSRP